MPLLKVNQIASYSGNTLTIGTTGDTVTLAAGSSVSGFGFDGVVLLHQRGFNPLILAGFISLFAHQR